MIHQMTKLESTALTKTVKSDLVLKKSCEALAHSQGMAPATRKPRSPAATRTFVAQSLH